MAIGIYLRGGPFRVGMFIPDVTIEAVGQDALGITGAPVETGATMTDHSFKLPVRLEMVAGWSDSAAGYDGYINEIYRKLLALQATRQPFEIFTSRRRYPNMLMESLTDPISANTYYAMIPRITFRELIISRTQMNSGATTAGVGEGAPAGTQPVVNQGEVQTQSVGSQVFAGAYNPGDYSGGTGPGSFNPGGFNPDGGTVANGSFGLGPLPGSPALDPNLSGISPPMSITLPEISVTTVEGIGGLQGAGPDQYSIFGAGP
ncbi:phage baseplate protein [Methylobacterium sp. A49B]